MSIFGPHLPPPSPLPSHLFQKYLLSTYSEPVCPTESLTAKGGGCTLVLMDFPSGWEDKQQVRLVKYIVCQTVMVLGRVSSRRGSRGVLKRGFPF